jgi:hypothetical protein
LGDLTVGSDAPGPWSRAHLRHCGLEVTQEGEDLLVENMAELYQECEDALKRVAARHSRGDKIPFRPSSN